MYHCFKGESDDHLMQLRKKPIIDLIWVRQQGCTNFAGIKPGVQALVLPLV